MQVADERGSARFAELDGLRGIAAAIVVLAHTVSLFDYAAITGKTSSGSHAPWDTALSTLPFMFPLNSNFAVCLFFILSGFVLTAGMMGRELTLVATTLRRYVRFTPVILATSLISFGLYLLFPTARMASAAITESAAATLQLPNGIPSFLQVVQEGIGGALLGWYSDATTINGALWTMPIEFEGSLLIIAVCVLSWFAARADRRRRIMIQTAVHGTFFLMFSHSYLSLFSAGALVFAAIQHGSTREALRRISPALLLIGAFVGTLPAIWMLGWRIPPTSNLGIPMPHHYVASFYHGLGAILVVAGVVSYEQARRFFTSSPAKFLGKISFPLYLIHLPVLWTVGCASLIIFTGHGWAYGPSTLASIALVYALVGLLAFLLVELDVFSIRASRRVGEAVFQMEIRLVTSLRRGVELRSSASMEEAARIAVTFPTKGGDETPTG